MATGSLRPHLVRVMSAQRERPLSTGEIYEAVAVTGKPTHVAKNGDIGIHPAPGEPIGGSRFPRGGVSSGEENSLRGPLFLALSLQAAVLAVVYCIYGRRMRSWIRLLDDG